VRWLLALAALGGCQTIFGLDKVGPPSNGDAGRDAKVFMDAPPAGTVCAGQAGAPLHICAPEATLTGLTYSISIDINTDDDSMCTFVDVMQNRQGALCVIAATDLTLEASGSITAHGSRPLVLVAMGTMTIAGTVDVSSHGAVVGAGGNYGCEYVPGQSQAAGSNTSGGGAGGSFGGRGGASGAPGNGGAQLAPAPIDPTTLTLVRGGCKGSSGGYDVNADIAPGGDSGGAVYLMAGTSLTISGKVVANGVGGAGGKPAIASCFPGGGGGGSGGLIMLDAPTSSISGLLMANGGGGGAGGSDQAAAGTNGTDPDPTKPAIAASGGIPTGDLTGGYGGAGSTLMPPLQGGPGSEDQTAGTGGGGGGGGGGQGVIRIFGTFAGGGTIVPAET
jgi:hypothetical protein